MYTFPTQYTSATHLLLPSQELPHEEKRRISATHSVRDVDDETRAMYHALACRFPSGMFASVLRAEEGTIFAPPARQEAACGDCACSEGDSDFSFDEGGVNTADVDADTPPPSRVGSPGPPPSVRATREGGLLQGLADLEISPSYPPYVFSPGEGSMSRSQGRAKATRLLHTSSVASGSDRRQGLQPRGIF